LRKLRNLKESNIYFLGDTHGQFNRMLQDIDIYNIENCNIIQVGDFGAGFGISNSTYVEIGKFLEERKILMYVIRGNHDDPAYFKSLTNYGKGLFFVPDYTLLTLEGKNLLLIGGGVSIDKLQREKDISWWEDETIKFDKYKYSDVDILVTHVPHSDIFISVQSGKKTVEYWKSVDEP